MVRQWERKSPSYLCPPPWACCPPLLAASLLEDWAGASGAQRSLCWRGLELGLEAGAAWATPGAVWPGQLSVQARHHYHLDVPVGLRVSIARLQLPLWLGGDGTGMFVQVPRHQCKRRGQGALAGWWWPFLPRGLAMKKAYGEMGWGR